MTDPETRHEERAIYVAMGLVGAALVVGAMAAPGTPDAGATFGAGFLGVAVVGIVRGAWTARRARLPWARVRA